MIHPHRKNNNRYVTLFVFILLSFNPWAQSVWGVELHNIQHLFDLNQADQRELNLPSDVAIAPDGRIYVVDGGNHRVVIFTADGNFQSSLGGEKGASPGQFFLPIGIAIDKKGTVYVADSGNHRIQVFDRSGKLLRHFPVQENKNNIKPIDVAVSVDGKKLYVTGNTNHKLMIYTPAGKLLNTWGKQGNNPGEFRYPATLTVDKNDSIYVVDVLNSRVQIFTKDGNLLTTAGTWGVLPGQLFRPKGVAVDNRERIYISDSYMDLIEVFDNQTKFSHVLGKAGKIAKFTSPGGITIDSDNRIYVTEMLDNKVSVYRLK